MKDIFKMLLIGLACPLLLPVALKLENDYL